MIRISYQLIAERFSFFVIVTENHEIFRELSFMSSPEIRLQFN